MENHLIVFVRCILLEIPADTVVLMLVASEGRMDVELVEHPFELNDPVEDPVMVHVKNHVKPKEIVNTEEIGEAIFVKVSQAIDDPMLACIVFENNTTEGTKKNKVTSKSKEAYISVRDTFAVKHRYVIFANLLQKTGEIARTKHLT